MRMLLERPKSATRISLPSRLI